jgi:hypothetical protein
MAVRNRPWRRLQWSVDWRVNLQWADLAGENIPRLKFIPFTGSIAAPWKLCCASASIFPKRCCVNARSSRTWINQARGNGRVRDRAHSNALCRWCGQSHGDFFMRLMGFMSIGRVLRRHGVALSVIGEIERNLQKPNCSRCPRLKG